MSLTGKVHISIKDGTQIVTEFMWLIERIDFISYYTQSHTYVIWDNDPWKAIWFIRKEDAQAFANQLNYQKGDILYCRAVEHAFDFIQNKS